MEVHEWKESGAGLISPSSERIAVSRDTQGPELGEMVLMNDYSAASVRAECHKFAVMRGSDPQDKE